MKEIVLLCCFVFFAYADKCDNKEMQEVLVAIKDVVEIPAKIDEITTLVDITCKNDTLSYFYEVELNKKLIIDWF